MSEIDDQLLEEIKELRRTVHAGSILIAALMHQRNDQNIKNWAEYRASAFGQMHDILADLRRGD